MKKIIDNIVIVDLKNEQNEHLIINSLNGLVDVISAAEFDTLNKWISSDKTISAKENEKAFFKQLSDRKYIMNPSEEKKEKERLLSELSAKREEIINNCKTAYFILSYDCNFACPYCFEKNAKKSNNLFTEEMVDRVLELYPDGLNHICFFGGEPLLPPNKKLVKYIMQKAPLAEYSVITNGYYLKEFLDLFLGVKTTKVQVTLDGSKDMHNKTRTLKNGNPTYDRILEGVELYISNKIPVRIRMNVSNDNIDDCLALKEILTKQYGNNDYLSFELQELFQIRDAEQHELGQKLTQNSENSMKKNELLKTLPKISCFLYMGKQISPCINSCSVTDGLRLYDNNGKIYSCLLSVGHENKSVGEFYPNVFLKDNSLLKRTILKIEKCKSCKKSLICGGGCGNGVISKDGNAFLPNCHTMEYEMNYSVPYYYKMRNEKCGE